MRKAFESIFAIIAGVNGAKHPFVGEHAGASAVEHENGQTVSMRLGAKPAPYNKHRGHMTKEGLFEPNLGFFGRATEHLFGKPEEELAWHQKVKDFFKARSNWLHRSSKRLR